MTGRPVIAPQGADGNGTDMRAQTRQPGGWSAVRVAAAVLALAPAALLVANGRAQVAGADGVTYYSSRPAFWIPFKIDPSARRIKEIRLYVADPQTRRWEFVRAARPGDNGFEYRAPRDGWYWFTTQTVDQDNRSFPEAIDQAQPGLKVLVDTQPPVVALRGQPSRDGQVSVDWQIDDLEPNPETLRVEYRAGGRSGWVPVPVTVRPDAVGQATWSPGTNGPVEVRLQVRDRAGNLGEATTTVNAAGPGGYNGGAGSGGVNTAGAAPPSAPAPGGGAQRRMVNSKHISLNYDISGTGKSGVAAVELYFTRDGRRWEKARAPEPPRKDPPYRIDVEEEGTYGFTLIARSGVGLGDPPPQAGDAPQVWVVVDVTAPKVQLTRVDVGRGQDLGNLTVTWSAVDKNIHPRPITLSYATRPDGPWAPIASGLENTGRYVWRMQEKEDLPYKFFVKVEAADEAGNTGSDVTPQEVAVDLSQPKVNVLSVEPVAAGKPGGGQE